MNRKNLTAAVLAGLAGAAGIAGTAQAVNINPDGLGQVLIYPYFTTNDGNQTVLSVVNTTDNAKAVKVRFQEGFNSREVLDFNLYMSHHDVWTAAIFDDDGVPSILTADTSCTVPDIQGSYPGVVGVQEFLPYAYTGDNDDDGPQGIDRAAEGYFVMIEMGTLVGEAAKDATHATQTKKDASGNVVDTWWGPNDCEALSDRWDPRSSDNIWDDEAGCEECQADTDTERNSGGLFGGAAVVNTDNGTMFSYDAIAIQGYDKTADGVHFRPGTIRPTLNDGSENDATVFFGVPQNRAVTLEDYPRSVWAISALFMHEHLMNEYVTDELVAAATEWVVMFPTKAWHVDDTLFRDEDFLVSWYPDPDDPGCGWAPGDDNPIYDDSGNYLPSCDDPNDCPPDGWEQCTFLDVDYTAAVPPFTELWAGPDTACEGFDFYSWDREEGLPEVPGRPGGPIFSPPPPTPDRPDPTDYEFCHEVNVLRFGDESIFGTPELDGASLLSSVSLETVDGWALLDFGADSDHVDWSGLVGLPVTGFAANEYENEFLGGGTVKAFYGGVFKHKGNVRRVWVDSD